MIFLDLTLISLPFSLTLSLSTDVLDGSAIIGLLNGQLLKNGVEGAADLLKCILPLGAGGGGGGLLAGLRAPLCALTDPSQTGVLGGLLGSVPILGGTLKQLGCPATTTTSSSATSSSTQNIASQVQSAGSQVTSAVGGAVSEVAGGASSVVGGVVSAVAGALGGGGGNPSRRAVPTPVARDL